MRLFLLPISTRQALVYCQRLQEKPASKLSLVQRTINKVPQTWSKWETVESGWKKTVTQYGNRALQRIPYQEWGLKSFPPLSEQVRAEQLTADKKIEVVYPGNIIQSEDVSKILTRLATERKHLHWRRFLGSLVALPFTVPFALIPVLPNLPFFYMAFRCYSHWKALRGSDHLELLINSRLLSPVSTAPIENIYAKMAPGLLNSFRFITRAQVLEGTDPTEELLLQPGAHEVVASSLQVPELAVEVERAAHQVAESIEKDADLERRQGTQSDEADKWKSK